MPATRTTTSPRRATSLASSRDTSPGSPTHTRKAVYACQLCDGQYSRMDGLRRHIRDVHEAEKPYLCEFPGCGKRSSQKGNANVHYRTHFPEIAPVYTCRKCNVKSYPTSASRCHHENKCSGDAPVVKMKKRGSKPRPTRIAPYASSRRSTSTSTSTSENIASEATPFYLKDVVFDDNLELLAPFAPLAFDAPTWAYDLTGNGDQAALWDLSPTDTEFSLSYDFSQGSSDTSFSTVDYDHSSNPLYALPPNQAYSAFLETPSFPALGDWVNTARVAENQNATSGLWDSTLSLSSPASTTTTEEEEIVFTTSPQVPDVALYLRDLGYWRC